jgi:hypothetical protein
LSWREYLLNLTTQRAAKLFGVFLGIGSISILSNVGLPWIPALAVVAYGGLLLYSAVKYLVPLSESTNNSPYFLGFLFFLVSLFRTFYWSAFQDGDHIDSIIRQLGAALLTTIVGLPLRQVLFAYSPTQADEDLFYRTLEEELRRSATEFRKSQAELVQLVQEFVEAKRTVFAEEQAAARHYIKSLTKATAMFDGSIESLPTVLTNTIESCLGKFKELDRELDSFSSITSGLDSATLKISLETVQSIGTTAKGLEGSLVDLRHSLTAANSAAGLIPSNLTNQMSDLKHALALVPTAAKDQIARIESDIQAIDTLLDSFVQLLERKVEAFR